MCRPTYYTVRDVKNPFMRGAATVDPQRALAQWTALHDAFAAAGVEPLEIEPVADLEDMTFAANLAFVGAGSRTRRFVVPSRMRFASRAREVPYYVAWFEAHGFAVVDLALEGDEYLEGHGDLVWQPGRSRVWAGYGFRSSRTGVERFARAMSRESIEVVPLDLADETFYHLDTCFATLGAEAALYYPGAFSEKARDTLRAAWPRLYEVSREDALRFVCNGAAVANRFIAAYIPPALEAPLRREGLQPFVVDTSEFEKGGGSVFCLKCFLPEG